MPMILLLAAPLFLVFAVGLAIIVLRQLRQETLTRFEARAARLPVLLTLPTVVFILPCVFLIVGGPAVIQVVGVLNKM